MKTILIACGGTGGHVAPGIALAQGLGERGYRCVLVLSRKQVDTRLLQRYPQLEYVCAPGVGLGPGLKGLLRFAWQQMRSIRFNIKLMRQYRPDACVAFGGFVSLGTFVASKIFGVPFALHEANRKAGKAVRLLQRWVDRLYVPEGSTVKTHSRVRFMGYPVRRDLKRMEAQAARSALGLDPDRPTLVVLGGSQGAQPLNTWVEAHAQTLAQKGIQLYCVSGTRNLGQKRVGHYRAQTGEPVEVHSVPFTDDMDTVLSAATLVVSRSGAGAIAEITHFQVPAVYVPFPYAADNHQHANAAEAVAKGLGWRLSQKNLHRLSGIVLECFQFPEKLQPCIEHLKAATAQNTLDKLIEDLETLWPPSVACQGT